MAFIPRFPEGRWDPISPYTNTGAFKSDGQDDTKFVLHRTQGDSYPRTTYRTGGGVPHWTILHDGTCYTHYEINQFSRALLNMRGGVQTNLDDALQVEIVGFTGQDLRPAQFATLARLMQWCLDNTSLQNRWLGGDPSIKNKLSNSEWDQGSGFLPHWFVPENNHHDTLTHDDWVKLKAVLDGGVPLPPVVKENVMGIFEKPAGYVIQRTSPMGYDGYAKDLQRELNKQMPLLGRPLAVDGYFGSGTETRVKQTQVALAVSADGVWGDGSHAALERHVDSKFTPAPIVVTPPPAPVSTPVPAAPTPPNSAALTKLLDDIEENITVALEDVRKLAAKMLE